MMHHERFLMQSDRFLDYPESLSGGLWWGRGDTVNPKCVLISDKSLRQ